MPTQNTRTTNVMAAPNECRKGLQDQPRTTVDFVSRLPYVQERKEGRWSTKTTGTCVLCCISWQWRPTACRQSGNDCMLSIQSSPDRKMIGWLHPRSGPPRGDLVLALTAQHNDSLGQSGSAALGRPSPGRRSLPAVKPPRRPAKGC